MQYLKEKDILLSQSFLRVLEGIFVGLQKPLSLWKGKWVHGAQKSLYRGSRRNSVQCPLLLLLLESWLCLKNRISRWWPWNRPLDSQAKHFAIYYAVKTPQLLGQLFKSLHIKKESVRYVSKPLLTTQTKSALCDNQRLPERHFLTHADDSHRRKPFTTYW